jgi:putative flippase GtrA
MAVDVLVSTNMLEIQWAKIITTVVFAIWNFLVFKLFIFSKKVSHEEKQDV